MSTSLTVLITGGNRGIGLALTEQLSARAHARVLVACRRPSEALSSLVALRRSEAERGSVEVISGIDVRAPQTLRGQLEERGVTSLDLCINNAGVLARDALPSLDYAQIQSQFEVNTLGPLKVVEACLELLREGSKVVNITSRMGSIADNTSGGMYGYRISKAALNMASVSLARDLAPRGIAVAVLHPGFVRTDMTGGRGLIETDESARGMIALMDQLTVETSGGFWHTNGEALPW